MKKNKLPNLVTIVALTTITVISWIFLSVLRVFTVKPAPPIPANILKPVKATLDTGSLDAIESRIYFEKGENITQPAGEENTTDLTNIVPEESPIPEESPVPEESPLP